MKELTISVSSIKTYCSSKAKRAGKYLLWIKDDTDFGDSLSIGKLFENWLMTGEDKRELIDNPKNMESLVDAYETLKHNSVWMEFVKGEWNKEVRWMLFWFPIVWYIDNYNEDCIDDIKTVTYLSKKDSNQINHWSGMTYYQEYELQMFVYMMLTWIKKWRILEVAKFRYKDANRHEHQIIEFNMTDDWVNYMTKKFQPIASEMFTLYNKFKKNES